MSIEMQHQKHHQMEQGQVQWRIRGRVVIPLVRIVRDCNEDYLLGSQDTAEQKVRELVVEKKAVNIGEDA